MDGVKWQHVSEMRSADHTFTDLSAGVYRLTANYLGTRTTRNYVFTNGIRPLTTLKASPPSAVGVGLKHISDHQSLSPDSGCRPALLTAQSGRTQGAPNCLGDSTPPNALRELPFSCVGRERRHKLGMDA